MKDVVILGGGITGLSTGWKLSESGVSVRVIEKEKVVGGLSSSFVKHGFILDYGPHKFYTRLPHILNSIKELLGNKLLCIEKKSSIRINKKYIKYPFRITELFLKINPIFAFKCGLSYFHTYVSNLFTKQNINTYEDFVISRFGTEIYNFIFKPYATKVWGNPTLLSSELAKTRIVVPNLLEVVKSIFIPTKRRELSASVFYYPKNGIQELSDAMAERIRTNGSCELETSVCSINIKDNRPVLIEVKKHNNKKIIPKFVVSTIPIEQLVTILKPLPPESVLQASEKLTYRSLVLYYFILKKERILADNWIFFPEKEFIFNRVSEQKGFSKFCCPENKTVICAEVTYDERNGIDKEKIKERVIADLGKAGLVQENSIETSFSICLPNVYPTYDLNFEKNLKIILDYLNEINDFITNGRRGLFNYNNMDHCMDMGFEAANYILSAKDKKWSDISKRFKDYVIID